MKRLISAAVALGSFGLGRGLPNRPREANQKLRPRTKAKKTRNQKSKQKSRLQIARPVVDLRPHNRRKGSKKH